MTTLNENALAYQKVIVNIQKISLIFDKQVHSFDDNAR
jgi:hypothetical protein